LSKILFIAAHRPGRSPSQRFRFEQYLHYLESNGFEYDFSWLISEKDDIKFYRPGNYFTKFFLFIKSMIRRMKNVMKTPYYDIIFVQREAFMTGSVFFEKRFSRSVAKFVFDFDDSIWLHDVSPANKTLAWLKKPDKTATIISLADCVIAGNEYLGSYAKKFNKNVWIIPTTIDTAYHRKVVVKKQADKICIGWTGTQTTIKHFETAINVLKKIKTKYGNKVYFIVISDMPDLTFEDIEIHSIPWQKETEIQDLCLFDIGLMPLPDDDWSKGKCGFKGLSIYGIGNSCNHVCCWCEQFNHQKWSEWFSCKK